MFWVSLPNYGTTVFFFLKLIPSFIRQHKNRCPLLVNEVKVVIEQDKCELNAICFYILAL